MKKMITMKNMFVVVPAATALLTLVGCQELVLIATGGGDIKTTCKYAILSDGQKYQWDRQPALQAYVNNAKLRGYTPETCATILGRSLYESPTKRAVPSIQTAKNKPLAETLSGQTEPSNVGVNIKTICNYAIISNGQKYLWDRRRFALQAYVNSAKRLGYTPETCATILGRSLYESPTKRAVPAIQTAKNKPLAETLSGQKRTPKLAIPIAQVQSIGSPVAADTTAPSIDIATSITVDTDSPTIRGRVFDDNEIAHVTVNGTGTDFRNGNFSFKRYVPPGGVSLRIEAIDVWGNKSSQTVRLVRTIVDSSDQMAFANLDPTKIRGQPNRDAVALIIGIANYTRAPDANYADSDASVFSDYAHRALGVPPKNIKVLTNNFASNTEITVSIKQWLRGRIKNGKTDVYVFYAGHGLASPNGENLYLLPYDGAPNLLKDTSLNRNDLFAIIAGASPKSATVFFDTCYSGLSRSEETLLAGARPILITAKHQAVPKGFTIFSAAGGQQISSGLDEAKHGLFSYYLMKGMEGDADHNSDREVTVGELHSYVRSNVQRQAIRLGREQTPELSGDAEKVLVRW
jgi:hypothetical protein